VRRWAIGYEALVLGYLRKRGGGGGRGNLELGMDNCDGLGNDG